MNAIVVQLITQMIYYMIVVIICLLGISLMLKGFFWKYVKVRMSFGRLLLVKPRSVLSDYCEIGKVEDGFLIYKVKTVDGKSEKRMKIDPNAKYIYRFLAVNWIDVDEEKNCLCKCDYTPVDGFDAKKFSDLLIRCIQKPAIMNNLDKIIIAGLLLVGLLALAGIIFGYLNMKNSENIIQAINGMRGIITGG